MDWPWLLAALGVSGPTLWIFLRYNRDRLCKLILKVFLHLARRIRDSEQREIERAKVTADALKAIQASLAKAERLEASKCPIKRKRRAKTANRPPKRVTPRRRKKK